jgi:hypothetical protein
MNIIYSHKIRFLDVLTKTFEFLKKYLINDYTIDKIQIKIKKLL